jgi:hypothetical protein
VKIYVIQNSGVEHNELLGFYTNKKLAIKDMDFIAKNDFWNGGTFQQRWVKCGKCWYEQSRSRCGRKKFPAWESPRSAKKHGWIHGTMHVAEYTVRDHSLDEMMRAIRAWQRRGDVHQLTCGNDSNHPALVPHYFKYPVKGVGLKCKHKGCDWKQTADHCILGLVHASFLRNRPQTA